MLVVDYDLNNDLWTLKLAGRLLEVYSVFSEATMCCSAVKAALAALGIDCKVVIYAEPSD